jgi:uncharacterized repeat protein (TIGR01451 family)
MTSHEPVLHALSVEPRSARAGETVRAVFRTRNLGALASPRGAVWFSFGEGLEPIGAPEVLVDPVDPGGDVTAIVHARVSAPRVERAEIAVCAELRLADRVLGTNICVVTVRSRPVLDGPASGTFVDAVDGETVRVRAIVTNEGDGPAGALRIIVPVPLGCASDACNAPAVLDRLRLAAGESAELAFEARIAEPVLEICADEGAVVVLEDGRRVALPVRRTLAAVAALATPEIVLARSRRRVEIGVAVRNDGWVDARDVRVRIALPDGLRPVDGSVAVDGMPVAARAAQRGGTAEPIARAEREGDARTVVVAVVPARATVCVALAAAFRPDCADGTIRLAVNDDDVAVGFAPHRARELRVRIVGGPRSVAPGEAVRIAARVENLGDVAEELTFAIDGASEAERVAEPARTLAAGTAAVVSVPLTVPRGVVDEAAYSGAFVVLDATGERARTAFMVPVRERVRPAAAEAALDADPIEPPAASIAPPGSEAGAAFAVRLVLEAVPPRAPAAIAALATLPPEPLPAADAQASCDPMEFSIRLDDARLDEIGRLLHGLRSPGLVGHLFALRLFFPDACAAYDAGVSAALGVVGDRLRDVFDRLFVKLRIPGYAVCCDDLEDGALRAAIVALLDRFDAGVDDGVPAAFAAAPFGAPAVLRAMTALLPARCDDDPRLAAALARHAALLDDALSRYEGVPLELFDEALAHRSEPALDAARADLVDALRPHLMVAEIAC